MDKKLFSKICLEFSKIGFKFNNYLNLGSLFFENKSSNYCIIIDDYIFSNNKKISFSYSEYTNEQNYLMQKYELLFRFLISSEKELKNVVDEYRCFISSDFGEIKKKKSPREYLIDPSPLESDFERAFIDLYGQEVLSKLFREYQIYDLNGGEIFIDFVIFKQDGSSIAIEKNGLTYHHPAIVGKENYVAQLSKQNSIVANRMKLFRWSSEEIKNFELYKEKLMKYLGDLNDIKDLHYITKNREVKLYSHQKTFLDKMEEDRKNGINIFLFVSPTGSGKTKIVIEDYKRLLKKDSKLKLLIMIPTKNLKKQMIEGEFNDLKKIFPKLTIGDNLNCQVVVKTNSWLFRNYYNIPQDYFDYIIVDEAHHSVAPAFKRVITHFTPKTLLGLTATPDRLDLKKLEDIFGSYDIKLNLKEAIQTGILAPIKAFRIKSNIDLSEVRYNGIDYVVSDLQKKVIVNSRDQLIVDTLNKYFCSSNDENLSKKSGIIFCVSVDHAERLAKLLVKSGISATSVSGRDKKSLEKIDKYQNGEIQFICSCSLINEGWDSPRTSIVVMARPTMSKVLYLQQLGRGTRKYPGKEALYVIDVVDSYGVFCNPLSVHSIFRVDNYLPWSNIFDINSKNYSNEEIILDGLYEKELRVEKINIFSFKEEYPKHLSLEEFSRELFVSTGTVRSWIKKKIIKPSVIVPFGSKNIYYFSPDMISKVIELKKLKEHNEKTIYEDFFEFLEKGDYALSYKIVFLLLILKLKNNNGDVKLDDLVREFKIFYETRLDLNLLVDREKSPFSNRNFLLDESAIKRNILSNPFEKFERKRFMYHSKDLNIISISLNLFEKINNESELVKIKEIMLKHLKDYYSELGGIPNFNNLNLI